MPPNPGEAVSAEGCCPTLETLYALARNVGLDEPLPAGLETIMQRFEVSKRVHDAYDEALRPIDRSRFSNLDRYVRLAEILEVAYARTGDVRFLNTLLKINDTLCAARAALEEDLGARLARLLDLESVHVADLCRACGVTPW